MPVVMQLEFILKYFKTAVKDFKVFTVSQAELGIISRQCLDS